MTETIVVQRFGTQNRWRVGSLCRARDPEIVDRVCAGAAVKDWLGVGIKILAPLSWQRGRRSRRIDVIEASRLIVRFQIPRHTIGQLSEVLIENDKIWPDSPRLQIHLQTFDGLPVEHRANTRLKHPVIPGVSTEDAVASPAIHDNRIGT